MISNEPALFLPRTFDRAMTSQDIGKWFANITKELEGNDLELTEEERASFRDYYVEAGLLTSHRFNFFQRHYNTPLTQAVNAIFGRTKTPKILDLGGGSGTQTILFALLGADVVCVDMDTVALEVLKKRKVLYEKLSGRTLNIKVFAANTFEFAYQAHAPFDAVYSLFAFNMMQPTSKLMDLIAPSLSRTACFVVQDGNREQIFNRLFRKRDVLSKSEMAALLRSKGFTRIEQPGCVSLPPPLWLLEKILPVRVLDDLFNKSKLLPVSYQHIAIRG